MYSIPELLCSFSKKEFPGVPIRSTVVEGPRFVRLATGQFAAAKPKPVPSRLKLQITWGRVEVKDQVFSSMPGDDSTL